MNLGVCHDGHYVALSFASFRNRPSSQPPSLPTSPKMKSGQVSTIPAPTTGGKPGTAGKGNPGLAGVFRTRDSRRGRVLQAPVVRRCIGVAVHSSAASSPAFRLSEDGIQRCCRRSFAESSTRHMHRGRRLGLIAQQKSPRAPCDGKGTRPGARAGLLLGDGFGQALDAGDAKERMTRNRQARQDAPGAAWRWPSPRPLRRLQTLATTPTPASRCPRHWPSLGVSGPGFRWWHI